MTTPISSPFVRTFFSEPSSDENDKIIRTIAQFGSNIELFSLLSSTEVMKTPHPKERIKRLAKEILFDSAEGKTIGYFLYAVKYRHSDPLKAMLNRFGKSIPQSAYRLAWSCFTFFDSNRVTFDLELLKVLESLVTSPEAISALQHTPDFDGWETGHWQVCSAAEVLDLSRIFSCAYKYKRPLAIERLAASGGPIRYNLRDLRLTPEQKFWLKPILKKDSSCIVQ